MTPQACYGLIQDALKRGRVDISFVHGQIPINQLEIGALIGWTVSAYLPTDAPETGTRVVHFHMPRFGGPTRITHESLK